jgi:hypothetical protein
MARRSVDVSLEVDLATVVGGLRILDGVAAQLRQGGREGNSRTSCNIDDAGLEDCQYHKQKA